MEKITILHIEDDKYFYECFKTEIEKNEKYKVITYTNGKEGVGFYLSHPGDVDIIVMDGSLPFMCGRDCIKMIRDTDIKVPIIACSSSMDYNNDMIKVGANTCMSKYILVSAWEIYNEARKWYLLFEQLLKD